MSNRTLIELNHDFCPALSNQALAEWAEKMASYMRSGDPRELPYGVTFKHLRHHSHPEPSIPKVERDHIVRLMCAAYCRTGNSGGGPQRYAKAMARVLEAVEADGWVLSRRTITSDSAPPLKGPTYVF